MEDPKANALGDLDDMLSHNMDTVSNAITFASMQMQSYSIGIMLADAGARAWDNRQMDPTLDAPIPSVTYKQQRFLDQVSLVEEESFNSLYE